MGKLVFLWAALALVGCSQPDNRTWKLTTHDQVVHQHLRRYSGGNTYTVFVDGNGKEIVARGSYYYVEE